MMEIYNEAVQDLLGEHVKGGMKVRENPKKGFYVDGLTVIPVQSFKEIEDHMEKVCVCVCVCVGGWVSV